MPLWNCLEHRRRALIRPFLTGQSKLVEAHSTYEKLNYFDPFIPFVDRIWT
jgi:hypothetical protein